MFGNKLNTVISINFQEKSIVFYSMTGDNRQSINIKRVLFRSSEPDEKFFKFFGEQLAEYGRENPSLQAAVVSVVVPDNAVVTDTVNIPAINRKAMDNGFELAMKTMYTNFDEMKTNKMLAASNKQYGTFFVTMIKKEFLSELNKTCVTNRFLPTFVTFPANTTVNAVGKLRPKFKRSSYLMLDIKENYTRVIFAVKGHAVGASVLPFGFEILSDKKVVAEDMLFDHSFADLTVINANERAKAKSLTMMAEDRSQTELEPGDVVNIDGSITKEDGTVIQTDGTIIRPDGTVVPPVENAQDDDGLVTGDDSNAQGDEDDDGTPVEQGGFKAYQRVARKLPKFMQRPTPTNARDFVYENFRIFVKWALSYLRGNDQLTTLAEPEFVLVNMPAEYDFLFERVNADKAEQKIEFVSFDPAIEDNTTVTHNLELFGAFYSRNVNTTNNF